MPVIIEGFLDDAVVTLLQVTKIDAIDRLACFLGDGFGEDILDIAIHGVRVARGERQAAHAHDSVVDQRLFAFCFRCGFDARGILEPGGELGKATAQGISLVMFSLIKDADRVGSEQYNLDLSQRRARFVVGALKQAGISEQLLKYFAFGESDPAVPTEDGVAEPRNRRVEIFIE
jgi:hypothetical protein